MGTAYCLYRISVAGKRSLERSLADHAGRSESLQPDSAGGEVDELGHPRLELPRACCEEKEEDEIAEEYPKICPTGIELVVNQEGQGDEIDDHGGRDEAIAQRDAGQAFRPAVIFRHRLQHDAPPEISVNLNVPFIPAGIGRVTPTFLVQQSKDRAEQMMPILPFFTPIASAAQIAGEARSRPEELPRASR